MKITLSKAQWELIGEKTNWLKKARLDSPVKQPYKSYRLLDPQEAELMKEFKPRPIQDFFNVEFESSTDLTKEFQAFYRDVKYFLNRGHFEFSGFVRNKQSGKWAHFSSSDVRHIPGGNFIGDWFNNLLVRTATGDKDYTGDSNNYTKLPNINQALLNLTK